MSKKLLPRNIDHIREAEGVNADVYFAHYKSDRKDWKAELGSWYDQNVDFSAERPGLKFWLAKDLLLMSKEEAEAARVPKVDINAYDFLWFLDEDAHFFHTDMAMLFRLARESEARIMTPAFTTPKLHDIKTSGELGNMINPPRMHKERSTTSSDLACQRGDIFCEFQAPKNCRFRYTNFVEVPFAMMKPQTFYDIIGGCEECLPTRFSTWGLNRVWCDLAAKKDGISKQRACAILDATPIIHANGKAHPKYKSRNFAAVHAFNTKVLENVTAHLKEYNEWPAVTWNCEQ